MATNEKSIALEVLCRDKRTCDGVRKYCEQPLYSALDVNVLKPKKENVVSVSAPSDSIEILVNHLRSSEWGKLIGLEVDGKEMVIGKTEPSAVKKKTKGGTISAEISCKYRNGYVLRWLSKNPISQFDPLLEEINFYDDKKDRDVVVPLESADIEFHVHKEKSAKDLYVVYFSGKIEFGLTREQRMALEKRDYLVDYLLGFKSKNKSYEPGEELFELVENKSIILDIDAPL